MNGRKYETMAKSIISNNKECFVCKTIYNLERHHIYAGEAYRPISEKYGLWVYLCSYHHREQAGTGAHNPAPLLDLWLKREGERRFIERYSKAEFIKLFGKDWLSVDIFKKGRKTK